MAEKLRVPLINAHRAVDDAEACGRVFVAMAKAYGAPEELDGMLEWAIAEGRPPQTGHIVVNGRGPEFIEGEFKGDLIEDHPLHLQWMLIATHRVNGEWQKIYPESLREWIRCWLRAKASGSPKSSERSFSKKDWAIDPAPWRLSS